jgi:hypothetical protein
LSESGAGCQGKEDNFRRKSSAKQPFTIPESSITLPESAPNFRDEFAVDSPLQRRVACEPDFRGVITRCGGRCRTTKAEYGPLIMPGKRQVATAEA